MYTIISNVFTELKLRIAPPILSFWCLPKKKERAAPGGRKKKALARTPCFLRHAVRAWHRFARGAPWIVNPASQRSNVREKTHETHTEGRGNDQLLL